MDETGETKIKDQYGKILLDCSDYISWIKHKKNKKLIHTLTSLACMIFFLLLMIFILTLPNLTLMERFIFSIPLIFGLSALWIIFIERNRYDNLILYEKVINFPYRYLHNIKLKKNINSYSNILIVYLSSPSNPDYIELRYKKDKTVKSQFLKKNLHISEDDVQKFNDILINKEVPVQY
jgi:hypothetical protein